MSADSAANKSNARLHHRLVHCLGPWRQTSHANVFVDLFFFDRLASTGLSIGPIRGLASDKYFPRADHVFSYVSTIGQLFSHTSTTPSNVVATSTVEFHQLSAGPRPSIPLQYVRRRDHLRCGEGRDLMVNCFGKQCEAQQICTACRSKTRVIN